MISDLNNMTLPFGLNYDNHSFGGQSNSLMQHGGFDSNIDINIMKHVFGGNNSVHKTISQRSNTNKSRKTNINNIKSRTKTKSKSRTQKKHH